MSYIRDGQAGLEAFQAGNFSEAISLLQKALLGNPKQPAWLVALAEAYLKIKPEQASDAHEAAERAYVAASLRGDRKLMIHAMHFRATSLYRLGRLADADRCCRWVLDLACGKPAVSSRADEECREDVDEEGRYKIPDFDGLAKLPFTSDYGKEGGRMMFFRGRVVSSLKALAEKEPDSSQLKPVVVKSPHVTFGHSSEAEQAEANTEEPTESTSAKPKTQDEKMDDLKVMIAEKSMGDCNVWQRYYTEERAKLATDATLRQILEDANMDYWKAAVPRTDFFQRGKSVTVTMYVKGGEKHLQSSTPPLGLRVTHSSVVIYHLPGWGDVGKAIKFKPFGLVQPFLTTWKVSPLKVEINLVSGSADRWPSLSQGKMAVVEDAKDDKGAWIPAPTKIHVSTGHPEPKSIDLLAAHDDSNDADEHVDKEFKNPSVASASSQTPTNPPPSTLDDIAKTTSAESQSKTKTTTTTANPSDKPPAYPTSSKNGPKDWDHLGDDEDDEADEGKSDPDAFFKQLYKSSSPEQQRAMMKSFVESNGTALSTDWGDVSKRTFKTEPPEGVEAKGWEK